MATKVPVTPVRGMRDFLPADLARRNRVLEVIRTTVVAHGFSEIETPCVEDIRKLKSKQGGENESMIFEIMRRGLGADEQITRAEAVDSGLRYDLTVPLSRYYANASGTLPAVFRAFQTGPVWRAERPQKGRFRQFRQCDIDILGDAGYGAEVEVLSVGCAVLERLGLLDRATIHVNDRRILDAVLAACEVPEEARPAALIELDKLDKSDEATVCSAVAALDGVGDAAAQRFMGAVRALSEAELSGGAGEVAVDGLADPVALLDVPQVIAAVQGICPQAQIVFDPSLVRGMGYYTGLIYEVKLDGGGSSVCGGGRYDHMVGRWLGRDVPAVGFSFGFERFVDLIGEDVLGTSDGVALAYRSEEEHLAALALQAKLANSEKRVGLVRMPKKLKGSFFDEVLEAGYSRLIMAGDLGKKPEEARAAARELGAK